MGISYCGWLGSFLAKNFPVPIQKTVKVSVKIYDFSTLGRIKEYCLGALELWLRKGLAFLRAQNPAVKRYNVLFGLTMSPFAVNRFYNVKQIPKKEGK